MNLWPGAAYIILAFISGSVPYSWLLGKIRGVDIRSIGSGNSGATNLARACGKGWGAVGLILDALKGAFPLVMVRAEVFGVAGDPDLCMSLAMVLAVLGHVYSPWLRFRGGKGVATTLGALVVLAPGTVGIGLAVFAVVFAVWHYVSLASVCGAVTLIPVALFMESGRTTVQAVITLVSVFIVVKHSSNIRRLIRGEEKRFGGDRRDD